MATPDQHAIPPTPSKIFNVLRSRILADSVGAEVARRSGLTAATVYRWYKADYLPDQCAAFERVLAAYGWKVVLERVPVPEESPLQLEVRDVPESK